MADNNLDAILQQALDEFTEDELLTVDIDTASDRAAHAAALISSPRPPPCSASSAGPESDPAIALDRLMKEMGNPDFQLHLAAALGSSEASAESSGLAEDGLLKTLEMLQRLTADDAVSSSGSRRDDAGDRKSGGDGDGLPGPNLTDEDLQRMASELEGLGPAGGLASNVDGMMQQLVSKEIMYEPMQKICSRFPSWLDENTGRLSAPQLAIHRKQFEAFRRILALYDSEPNNFPRLMELLGELQEYGQPPAEIVRELAPGLDLGDASFPGISECGVM
jgi:hypothetical protein